MNLLDYTKQFYNFNIFLVLLDDSGLTDDDIMTKFDVSKQRIYDARKQLEPLIKALETIDAKQDKRDPNIQLIINTFADCFGTTKSTAYDRYAAKRLHVKYTAPEIAKLIEALSNLMDDQYAPTVNSVVQFENKLPQIVKFVRSKTDSAKMIDI
jgi:predicted DNA-binding protein YlxM (UPF0122 family)